MEFFGVRGYGYTSMRLMFEGPLDSIELPRDPLTESNLKVRRNGVTELDVIEYSVNGRMFTLDVPLGADEFVEIYYLDYEAPISVEVINLINELNRQFIAFKNSAQDILANSEAARLSAQRAEEAAERAEEASGSIGNVMRPQNNLSDLHNIATARNNLGLGTLATQNSIDQSMKVDKGVDLGTTNINTLGAASSANIYYQQANANATSARGYPIAEAGTLYVTRSAYGCQQMYISFSSRRVFVRGLQSTWNGVNGPWFAWREIGAAPPTPTWGNLSGKPFTDFIIAFGAVNHGGTIPVPSGYTRAQCRYLVSMNDINPNRLTWDWRESGAHAHLYGNCTVNQSTGVVTCQTNILGRGGGTNRGWIPASANYILYARR